MPLIDLLKQYDLIAGIAPEGTPKYTAKELAKEYMVKAYEAGGEDVKEKAEKGVYAQCDCCGKIKFGKKFICGTCESCI